MSTSTHSDEGMLSDVRAQQLTSATELELKLDPDKHFYGSESCARGVMFPGCSSILHILLNMISQ